tara:strand:+ start:31822 stop:32163 length:342 start_codon:yes stop_codon:yes gene_type:complete
MKTPYLDEMINELDGYIGSSDNYLSKRGNEKLTELKAVKEQLLLYGVSNWVDCDSLPEHIEKVLVFGKLEPWSENELHTAVLNKAGGLNHWYTGGTRMHEVSKWKRITAPPCY